ncbi:MAG TPA: EAL domain-containing protein [Pyrinomonadaceae bacterium]|nr:EAL domain-containing protein [Pyrinomonadaceae bacterium]
MNGTQPRVAGDRPKPSILIADDDRRVRTVLRELLRHDYACREVSSAEEALHLLGAEEFALVLSDITMEGLSGLEMLPRVAEIAPDTLVVMISAEQKIESAIRAMRTGAFDYITKPFVLEHVEAAVFRALEHQRLREEKRRHEEYLEELLRQRTAELDHASYHDRQTGLPNRVLFEDRLAHALTLDAEGGESLAVLLLDLDDFKKINELLGYQVGDRLLRELADRLRDCVEESVTVARFGGDEFALLVPRVADARDAIRVAHRVREGLRPSFNVNGYELYVRASIGISLSPGDGQDAETLLRNTGAALRRAREQGGGLNEFYTAGMNAQALMRLSLESDLRRALERDEFVVYYEPQYRLSAVGGAMRISGAEALVRWRHPELGLVPPGQFIPLAEETGLILPLGEQVLRAACAQNMAWQKAGFSPLRVAVNISARQFHHRSLSGSVLSVLSEVGLDPRWLELELTESSLVIDAGRAVGTLSGLRELGVKIAVDDFGTGYSSLSYLIDLPIDTLKIDRSFVCDATTNAKRAKLLKGIVTLAHDLKLRVKAEGVETAEQREMLCRFGCDDMQGYLFSRPVPAGEFEAMLRRDCARPD